MKKPVRQSSQPAPRERIQKVLANAGHGSRREIESWIKAGRIKVNGKLATLGIAINESDRIELDGKRLRFERANAKPRVIAVHKPVGVICSTRSERGERTIYSLLPKAERSRWVAVGRLDINTSGLMLFTDNGDLANRLMHPRYHIDREYAVRVFGQVSSEMLQRLREGVEIEGEMYQLADIVEGDGRGANRWYYCVVRQGRNREVRRIWESQGLQVSRLVRVRFGNVVLPRDLRVGKTQYIEGVMLEDLCRLVHFTL